MAIPKTKAEVREALALASQLRDPLRMFMALWPKSYLYREQRQVLYSYFSNDETQVPAGNMMGKDYVTGRGLVIFVVTRHPVRAVTTSAKDDHLRVLWGEIGQAIHESAIPLLEEDGGPLILTHQTIKKVVDGEVCPLSYAIGMVSSPDRIAAMQGHHIANTGDGIPRTLFVSDESSSVPDDYYKMATTWANRIWVIGNTWECQNFFYRGVKAGDKPRPFTQQDVARCQRTLASVSNGGIVTGRMPPTAPNGYYRKVIRIKAEDSPNVRYAVAQLAKGLPPTNEMLVPGVKSWAEYQKNRSEWDPIQQSVSLDAQFYEGAEVRMYPGLWLDRAERFHHWLVATGRHKGRRGKSADGVQRRAKGIGIDPAEGGDKTSMCAVDDLGIIELVSRKTKDTSVIPNEALSFMLRHGCTPDQVCFDRGGGGKQHADALRSRGYDVRTIAFGERVAVLPKPTAARLPEKVEVMEDRYVYANRRAQMYGELMLKLDPVQYTGDLSSALPDPQDKSLITGFAIPSRHYGVQYEELRKQLEPIPKTYDKEGQLYVLSKHKKNPESKELTLVELIGHSPDELDALVLAVHAMLHPDKPIEAGGW